jgi:hypothetical protein
VTPHRLQVSQAARALAAAAVVTVLVGAGVGARALAQFSWTAVVRYPTPFALPLATGSASPPLAARVVLVVVDGLREDASWQMPALDGLRARGSSLVAWAGEPSLSLPGWTVIATGAPQAVSGVTTNWYRGPVRVDSLFASARRSGLRTAVAGTPGWADLFGPWVDEVREVPDPHYGDTDGIAAADAAVAAAAAGLLQTPARLVVVHFPGPDVAAHSFGAASPTYADAVRKVDAHLAALARAAGPQDVLIVTADHGHLARGGHGGWEPEVKRVPVVLAGRAIRPGGRGPDVRQEDIAPTVAVLLGIPVPAHSMGRPLVEALAADTRPALRGWIRQQMSFADAYARALGATRVPDRVKDLASADPDTVQREVWAYPRQVARDRLAAERAKRLSLVLACLAAGTLYALWAARRRTLGPAVAGTLAYLLTVQGLFFGRGLTWSLSVFNTEEQIMRFFAARTTDAAAALAVGAVVAGAAAVRHSPGRAALAGVDAAALTAAALGVQIAYFVWLWGVRFTWYLPDLRLGFKYYLDLLQLVPVGVLAPAAPALAVAGYGAARLVGRARQRRAAAPPSKRGSPKIAGGCGEP